MSDENGNGKNGFGRMGIGVMVGVPFAAISAVGTLLYKSIDDRVEVRRREIVDVAKIQTDHAGKIAENKAEIVSIREENKILREDMHDIRVTVEKIREEQISRTPFIKKSEND